MATAAQAKLSPLPTRRRLVQVTALAWIAIIGFDLLMNAGLLARFYHFELPGFLPPVKMFQFIPLGYAAFLLHSITLVWLIVRMQAFGIRAGAAFGAKLGILVGGAGFLGWMSLFSFPTAMLAGWAVFHTLEFTLAGAVIGSALAAPRMRTVTYRVLAFMLLCIIGSVVLQNLGLVPAIQKHSGNTRIGWDPNH